MKISLRRANALQQSIATKLSETAPVLLITIDEHVGDASSKIETATQQLRDTVKLKENLIEVLFNIRSRVGAANAGGVNDRLAKLAGLQKLQGLYDVLSKATPREAAAITESRLQKLRAGGVVPASYTYTQQFAAPLLPDSEIAAYVAQLGNTKRAITKLQDELLELNIRTEIELTAGEVALLTSQGLL